MAAELQIYGTNENERPLDSSQFNSGNFKSTRTFERQRDFN